MAKREKIRKDIKILAAWVDEKKQALRCRGLVDDIEVDFIAAQVGVPDKNGKIVAKNMDDLYIALASAQERIKKGVS